MPRADLEEWADELFITRYGLLKRKTFSCPSYYLNGKMLAFIYHDALGIKLPPEEVLEKIREDGEVFVHFNPGDGIMKNWLFITRDEAGFYDEDIPLIERSLELLKKAPMNPPKKKSIRKTGPPSAPAE